MRWAYIICILGLLAETSTGQMIRNDSIGNDPAKERVCALRAGVSLGKSRTVPFEIDSSYVARSRSLHPDATFIAIGGQLVECFLRAGTGRYEPDSFSPEQGYWHLIKPKQFQPGYATNEGERVASSVCLKAASSKTDRPDYDHSSYFGPIEGPRRGRAVVAGKKIERYDIVLNGTLFFRSGNLDLAATSFTCLLSPMLEFKAIQFK
jgi:hypothetical protein